MITFGEPKRVREKAASVYFKTLTQNSPGETKKTTKTLNLGSPSDDQESNGGPPKYEGRVFNHDTEIVSF
jgi:hypothetical protein